MVKDTVSPDNIEELVATRRWVLEGHVTMDPEQGVHFSVVWRVDEGTTVRFTEDNRVEERYFVVTGDDWRSIEDVMADIRSGTDIWSLDDLILEFDGNVYPAGKAEATLRLGVGSPLTVVDPIKDRIITAARNRETRVRRGALWAMAYSAWPEYLDPILRLADGDPDERIAHEAAVILRNLSEEGGNR